MTDRAPQTSIRDRRQERSASHRASLGLVRKASHVFPGTSVGGRDVQGAVLLDFNAYHVTVHIDCDHWWALAEARILQVGFAITEEGIRDCQNLTPSMMDDQLPAIAYSQ